MKTGKRGASRRPVAPGSATPAQPRGKTAARSAQRGASVQKTRISHRFESYRNHHRQVAAESLDKMLAAPLPTLMTMMVIAIALALPTGLLVVLKNAQALSRDWDGSAQISLYMKQQISAQRVQQLGQDLQQKPEIARTQYISREQALEEFRVLSGFGELLEEITDNPLPAVLVIYPVARDLQQAKILEQELAGLPEVDSAQLDAQWVQRLHAILELGERMVWSLTIGLSLAVLLVVFNTIRLMIENRREEIVIIKMVGGTDGFVRRPFLYTGTWYGIGGGVIAFVLTESVLIWVDSPVNRLADLYESEFVLSGLGFGPALTLLLGSGMLGLLGSWLAVGRHLKRIEPR